MDAALAEFAKSEATEISAPLEKLVIELADTGLQCFGGC
jgi:hypothetical protein